MKKIILIMCLVLFLSVTVQASEELDLSTPITPPATSYYKIASLILDWAGSQITINLTNQATGQGVQFIYTGSTAMTLMVALNKMDLSTTSLHKRILQRLITDGKLSGSVSGAPD